MYFIFTKKEICKNPPNISLFDTRPLNLIWIWTWNKIKYTSLSSIDNSKYETENISNWEQKLSKKNRSKYNKTYERHNILFRVLMNSKVYTSGSGLVHYLHFSVSRICRVTFVNYNTSLRSPGLPLTPWQLPGGPAQPNWPMGGLTAGSNWPMTASLRGPLDQSSPQQEKQKQAVTWRCLDNSQSICMTYLQHFIYKLMRWAHSEITWLCFWSDNLY